jgi:hypothetical protein
VKHLQSIKDKNNSVSIAVINDNILKYLKAMNFFSNSTSFTSCKLLQQTDHLFEN